MYHLVIYDDVLPDDVPVDDEPPEDVPLRDIFLPTDDVPLDGVPLDDEADNSIFCLDAFPMAGCLIDPFLSEKAFISCCDNSTIKSIMQVSNRNFEANFLPCIL